MLKNLLGLKKGEWSQGFTPLTAFGCLKATLLGLKKGEWRQGFTPLLALGAWEPLSCTFLSREYNSVLHEMPALEWQLGIIIILLLHIFTSITIAAWLPKGL